MNLVYIAFWFAGALCGFLSGNAFAQTLYSYETVEGDLVVFGDWITLVLFVICMIFNYSSGILYELDPITCSKDWFCGLRAMMFGGFIGFFTGRFFGLRHKHE